MKCLHLTHTHTHTTHVFIHDEHYRAARMQQNGTPAQPRDTRTLTHTNTLRVVASSYTGKHQQKQERSIMLINEKKMIWDQKNDRILTLLLAVAAFPYVGYNLFLLKDFVGGRKRRRVRRRRKMGRALGTAGWWGWWEFWSGL